jgi:hypothetical protein
VLVAARAAATGQAAVGQPAAQAAAIVHAQVWPTAGLNLPASADAAAASALSVHLLKALLAVRGWCWLWYSS